MNEELRNEVETKLTEVAKILNCKIELKDKDYSSNIIGKFIFNDAEIQICYNEYQTKDKIQFYVSSQYQSANGRNEYLSDYMGVKKTSINVSYTKSPEKIAKDIINRILEDARHDYKILQDKIKSENEYLNKIEDRKDHAKQLGFFTDNIGVGNSGRCWHKTKGINLELETFSDEYKLMVRIKSKEDLSQLMEVINKIVPDKNY